MKPPLRYERVTILPSCDTPRRTVLLRIMSESDRFLTGTEVTASGDEVIANGFDVRRHIIEKIAIKKRVMMKMNLRYGWLERMPEKEKA